MVNVNIEDSVLETIPIYKDYEDHLKVDNHVTIEEEHVSKENFVVDIEKANQADKAHEKVDNDLYVGYFDFQKNVEKVVNMYDITNKNQI